MKKFELSTETKINWFGRTLYRVKALTTFADVTGEEIKAGDLGGYVEKEVNLSQDGNAWVYGNAEVYGNAWVYGDAKVCGNACVYRVDHIFIIGPAGSRSAFTTFFHDKDNEITVACGCFLGKIADFLEKVTKTHGDNKHALVYRAAVEIAKLQIDLTSKEK